MTTRGAESLTPALRARSRAKGPLAVTAVARRDQPLRLLDEPREVLLAAEALG